MGAHDMRPCTIRLAIRHAILMLAFAPSPAGAETQADVYVDLALVLAVDSSASIDFDEFKLQTIGLAYAFRDSEIIEAIQHSTPKGVAVTVVQWSGRHEQPVAVDWTRIGDRASAEALAVRIERMGRLLMGDTAIGEALRFVIRHIERGPFRGSRQTIDVSGDGHSNHGYSPAAFRDGAVAAGITINGLAILNEDITLDRYYADHVIGGRDAFVITTRTFEDFARAMRLKLLQEIRGAPRG
jgi:hypothetical protein